ncbi:ATP synthase F1 subunit delta [Sporohalobacter salinus]|uniref:ATP synthase F1 subunit delta n=1 Tax=Sporohalobacter salinus TaxID=1494606 RepID=UPI001960A360|nr:ATP synthase F1 subunit delta [Sporohalobacter salinus]MBM7622897.1 F-type H+-transporting ATPase subunit delta [Sporohalobacter salinus]
MLDNQIVEKYSQSLFELAIEKNNSRNIQQELNDVVETIKEHEDLNEVIYHPRISQQDKKDLVEKIFADDVSKILLNFFKLLIDKRRERFIEPIAENYIELMNQENELLEVEVKSAIELSSQNKERLKEKLEKLTEKEVDLQIEIDSSLIGGLVLKVGDKVVDGSLAKHLEVMKNDLTKLEVGVN